MKKYLERLKKIPLFFGIQDDDILSLLDCLQAKVIVYEPNSMIFTQGDDVSLVGIVLLGNVQVFKDDFYGNRSIVSTIGELELFAEAFVCAGIDKMPVSVISNMQSEIMLINYRKLTTVCQTTCGFHSKMVFNMLKIMSNKNISMMQKNDVLSKRTTRQKVMQFLYNQAEKNSCKTVEISFNRQQMADYLFVDRSALSYELSKLKKEKIIDFNKNRFKIL